MVDDRACHRAAFPRVRFRRQSDFAHDCPRAEYAALPLDSPLCWFAPRRFALISEQQRREYLAAMQIECWLPRVQLPFAARSELEVLEVQTDTVEVETVAPVPSKAAVAAEAVTVAQRIRPELPRPAAEVKPTLAPQEAEEVRLPARAIEPPPRFSLQLMRAGDCLLLVELPNGEAFQRRDPAYVLLRDLLRAACLPDSPQLVGDGEPIRWPLLKSSALEQGPDAARDYVQAVVAGVGPSSCLWLIGLSAIRFAGERDESAYNQVFSVEELGRVWALPGLELLMEEPARKAPLWQAMRRLIPSWSRVVE